MELFVLIVNVLHLGCSSSPRSAIVNTKIHTCWLSSNERFYLGCHVFFSSSFCLSLLHPVTTWSILSSAFLHTIPITGFYQSFSLWFHKIYSFTLILCCSYGFLPSFSSLHFEARRTISHYLLLWSVSNTFHVRLWLPNSVTVFLFCLQNKLFLIHSSYHLWLLVLVFYECTPLSL